MYQDYFIVNGEKYYTGTVFLVKDLGNQVEATFICYDTERHHYVYKIKDCRMRSPDKIFWNTFIAVTDKINSAAHPPVTCVKRDRDISGLFIGWVWYVFLMAISTIFKDAIGLWIFISIVFFNWRSKKIKEEGTYIEW